MLPDIQDSTPLFDGSWTPSPCPSDNSSIQEEYGVMAE